MHYWSERTQGLSFHILRGDRTDFEFRFKIPVSLKSGVPHDARRDGGVACRT